jgi:predicted Zn-dependent protease
MMVGVLCFFILWCSLVVLVPAFVVFVSFCYRVLYRVDGIQQSFCRLTIFPAVYKQNPLHETLADNGGNQGTCYDFGAPLL